MVKNVCAICHTSSQAKVVYKQNFRLKDINRDVFSARRTPDGLHYQIYRCSGCGLLFSNPVLPEKTLKKLYRKSRITYGALESSLVKTYGYYLKTLNKYRRKKERFLDIGCGDGFMLTEAKRQGYKEVFGIEPSLEAIQKAPKEISRKIKNNIFQKGIFRENYFDTVTIFQTLDHILKPNTFLKECYRVLKPGGSLLAINHDADSLPAKIIGERFPIFDIEHPFLYNLKTMRKIFQNNGFKVCELKTCKNICQITYIIGLFPVPEIVKRVLVSFLKLFKLDGKEVRVGMGNILLVARKP